MKQLILGFLLVTFSFLTNCSGIDDNVVRQVELSQTAASYTLTPRCTPDPCAKMMIDLINFQLQIPEDPLSKTLDATYTVVDASFTSKMGNIRTIFSITVQCQCADDGDCCNAEHTFVLITRALKEITTREISMGIPVSIQSTVPDTITELQVSCNVHHFPVGTMYVSWPIMREYLLGKINGDQLGWVVRKDATLVP